MEKVKMEKGRKGPGRRNRESTFGDFVGWVNCRNDGYYGGDFNLEDKGKRSTDPCSARSCKRMDGKRRGHCGWMANCDFGIGVSLLDCVYGDDSFLSSEPENRSFA